MVRLYASLAACLIVLAIALLLMLAEFDSGLLACGRMFARLGRCYPVRLLYKNHDWQVLSTFGYFQFPMPYQSFKSTLKSLLFRHLQNVAKLPTH